MAEKGLVGKAGYRNNVYDLATQFLIDLGSEEYLIARFSDKYFYYAASELLLTMNFRDYGGELNPNSVLVVNYEEKSFKLKNEIESSNIYNIPEQWGLWKSELHNFIVDKPLTITVPIKIQNDILDNTEEDGEEEFTPENTKSGRDFIDNLNLYLKRNLLALRNANPSAKLDDLKKALGEYVHKTLTERSTTYYVSDKNIETQIVSGVYNSKKDFIEKNKLKSNMYDSIDTILMDNGFGKMLERNLVTVLEDKSIRVKYLDADIENLRIEFPVITDEYHIRKFKAPLVIVPNGEGLKVNNITLGNTEIECQSLGISLENDLKSLYKHEGDVIYVDSGIAEIHSTINGEYVDLGDDLTSAKTHINLGGYKKMDYESLVQYYISKGEYDLVIPNEMSRHDMGVAVDTIEKYLKIELPKNLIKEVSLGYTTPGSAKIMFIDAISTELNNLFQDIGDKNKIRDIIDYINNKY